MTTDPASEPTDTDDRSSADTSATEGEDNGSTEKDGEDAHLHDDQKSTPLPS